MTVYSNSCPSAVTLTPCDPVTASLCAVILKKRAFLLAWQIISLLTKFTDWRPCCLFSRISYLFFKGVRYARQAGNYQET